MARDSPAPLEDATFARRLEFAQRSTNMSVDERSKYYDAGGIEVIEIIRAKLTPEQYTGFLLGNIIKYSTRAMHKGAYASDVRKIAVYAKLLEGATRSSSEPPAPNRAGGSTGS